MTETPLDRIVRRAASRVERLEPPDALRAQAAGPKLTDLRPPDARARHGVVSGALHIPLTVLPWRLEPGGRWRSPFVDPADRVVLLCDAGCSSLLAAEQLLDLGLEATDVVGGVAGWRRAGLPLLPAADAPLAKDEWPGLRGPDLR